MFLILIETEESKVIVEGNLMIANSVIRMLRSMGRETTAKEIFPEDPLSDLQGRL